MAEDLTPQQKIEFDTLRASGDIEALKAFVSTNIVCPRDGTPANFGDGSSMPPCDINGGTRRRRRKSIRLGRKYKTLKNRRTNKKCRRRSHGKKSKKSKKSKKTMTFRKHRKSKRTRS